MGLDLRILPISLVMCVITLLSRYYIGSKVSLVERFEEFDRLVAMKAWLNLCQLGSAVCRASL